MFSSSLLLASLLPVISLAAPVPSSAGSDTVAIPRSSLGDAIKDIFNEDRDYPLPGYAVPPKEDSTLIAGHSADSIEIDLDSLDDDDTPTLTITFYTYEDEEDEDLIEQIPDVEVSGWVQVVYLTPEESAALRASREHGAHHSTCTGWFSRFIVKAEESWQGSTLFFLKVAIIILSVAIVSEVWHLWKDSSNYGPEFAGAITEKQWSTAPMYVIIDEKAGVQ